MGIYQLHISTYMIILHSKYNPGIINWLCLITGLDFELEGLSGLMDCSIGLIVDLDFVHVTGPPAYQMY